MIEAMVPMVRELGLAVTFTDLNFPSVQKNLMNRARSWTQLMNKGLKIFLTNSFG